MLRSLFPALCAVSALGASGCASDADAAPGAAMFESSSRAGFDNLGEALGVELDAAGASISFANDDRYEAAASTRGLAATPAPASRPAARERLMVHSGQLDLAVGDLEAAGRRAGQITENLGGYVQSLTDVRLNLRIPADRWEEGLEALSALGRVLARDLRVQDVTEEHVDVQLQLKNLRELSDRLSELLARAETVQAALEVETQLARVRGEIERLQGRLNFLNDRIALATLTLQLHRVAESRSPRRLPFLWLQELGVERLLGLPGASR